MKTNVKNTLSIISAAFGILVGASASAQPAQTIVAPRKVESVSELKPHFAILAGIYSPEGSNRTRGAMGFDVGIQPYIPFGVGIEYSHANYEDSNYQTEYRDEVLAKATYNFGGETPVIKYSYVGIGAGVSFSGDEKLLISSPLLGFDYPVVQFEKVGMSLGAQAKYLVYEGNHPDSMSANGVVKLWF